MPIRTSTRDDIISHLKTSEVQTKVSAAQSLSIGSLLKKHAALLITLLLFGAGLYALYRLLSPLDYRDVLASIRATPARVIVLAIAATCVGYIALVGYDWSATRYIGRKIPLPSVALGGFLGYAIGNTVGLSALSGSAVRYRIYASLGLTGYEVAAISMLGALAFGLGGSTIGLAALALHPTALEGISLFSASALRFAALAGLAVIGLLLVLLAARQAPIRFRRFVFRPPKRVDILRQMAFTLVEFTMAALTLFILLPSGALPFTTFVAVYAVASMIGVASHVPGGVGIFESVVIAALPASVPVSDAVTGLLLFRLIYFLLPFMLALLLLSLSEFWTARVRPSGAFARFGPVVHAGQSIIPTAMGMLVLGSGLFMMFAGLLPNPTVTAAEFETLLPLAMIEGGALLSSIVGSALIILALGIFRRSRAAFWLVLIAVGAGIFAALLHGRDLDRVVMLALMALLLLPCRREFYRTARLTQGILSAPWLLFMLAIVASIGLTFYIVYQSTPYASAMWWQFGLEADGPRAQRTVLTASVALTLALLFAALRTGASPAREPTTETLKRAHHIIDAYGAGTDMLALTGDKMLMFADSGDAVLSYGIRGASWIALAAPVGEPAARVDLAWSFHDAARAAGARPVFYEAPESFMNHSVEMGLALHKMGEEAVVSLAAFSLDGPARKKLRTTYNRAMRDGLTFEILDAPHDLHLIAELRTLSDAWLKARSGREKRFSVGRFDNDYLQRFPLAMVRLEGRVVAFANLMLAAGRRSSAVDLMRHGSNAPSNTMEFLFIALMVELSARGYQELSLGMSPLAGLTSRRGADLWTRFGALVYRRGDRFYNFEGLRRFKNKFDPDWRPRYLCCRSILPPVAPLADAALLIAGSARGLVRK